MSTVMLPTPTELMELFEHRHAASVTICLPSSPDPTGAPPVRLQLKNAVAEAEEQFKALEVPKRTVWAVINPLRELVEDEDFWREQSHGLAILAAPDVLNTYAIPETVRATVDVGDRWDLGPLLRGISHREDAYVVGVSEGSNHLFLLAVGARPQELDLELPDDLDSVLQYASNDGHADTRRPAGATGDRIEHHRYCKIVQDAVLTRVHRPKLPMILTAIDEFESAYRDINAYPNLLDRGIATHPDSLSPDELESRARLILDDYHRMQLEDWRDRFRTRRAHQLGVQTLGEVARAAAAAAVEELLYDVDAQIEGSIDDLGVLTLADEPGPTTYDVVDEIAVRVFGSGGLVRAVNRDEIPDGAPVAAILRFPV
jgi:hypothetical protein